MSGVGPQADAFFMPWVSLCRRFRAPAVNPLFDLARHTYAAWQFASASRAPRKRTRPSPAVSRAPRAQRAPRPPRPAFSAAALTRRAPCSPHPQRVAVNHSFLNEWRQNVHLAANFAFGTFQKPPLIQKCSKSRHSFEASPLSSGNYRRKARPVHAATFQKPPLIKTVTHRQMPSKREILRASLSFPRRFSPPFFKTLRSAYPITKHAK